MRDRRVGRRADRGAVVIIVAVFMLVAVAMMAFVVDIGGLRSEGKEISLSTDAAALAAASVIDFSYSSATTTEAACGDVRSTDTRWGSNVDSVAKHYVEGNGGSTLETCRIFFGAPGTRTAYVTVTATEHVKYVFAKAIGQNGGTVTASSSARIAGSLRANVYPVGLCTAGANLALGGQTSKRFDPPEPWKIEFDDACGGTGNKRQIQFVPGDQGNACASEAVGMWCWDFISGGYNGVVSQIVESDTGKDWQKAEPTIKALAEAKTHIWIPVVTARPDLDTSGTKANYEVTHFAEVRITSYSKKRGLGFSLFQIIPFSANGPQATSDVHSARVHLCGTGQGTAACDVKAVAPPAATPPPTLDFRDLCKVTDIASPAAPVWVDAGSRLVDPLTVSYTVEDSRNCDPFYVLRAVSSVRTVPAPEVALSGHVFNFRFPAGTLMAPDGTAFRLDFIEDNDLVDSSRTMTIVGPCTVSSASASPAHLIAAAGNSLQETVTVRINLTRATPCAGLTVTLAERKTNGTIGDVNVIATNHSPTTATFDITIGPGTPGKWSNNAEFEVHVSQGTPPTPLPYSPLATMKTKA